MLGIVGLGFVGLTTALGFCEKSNYEVYGCEKDALRLSSINSGKAPFYEPHLDDALEKYLNNRFVTVSSPGDMINTCSVIFFCVGTPANNDGSADLSILESAIRETFRNYNGIDNKILVIKSTVPPGTTAGEITEIVASLGFGNKIGIANNPEFLREGFSWNDFIYPDRIVIGEDCRKTGEAIAKLYEGFNAPVFRVSLNTGEFIKYLSNTLLATLISFSNEMSMAADFIGGINVKDAFKILHLDGRWSGNPAKMTSYVYPGCGYGGYCLPKDTKAFSAKTSAVGFTPKMLKATIEVNEKIRPYIVEKIDKVFTINDKIGILGLSFKPGSNDVRDAPAAHIISGLLDLGYKNISAHDPIAINEFSKNYDFNINYNENLCVFLDECDGFVLVTSWRQYYENADIIKGKPFVDARYFL